MTDTYRTRIPAFTDAELRQYLARFEQYRAEAVQLALAEAERRGLTLSAEERARMELGLAQRDLASPHQLEHRFLTRLGATLDLRLRRVHQLTVSILAAGLGTATLIYLLAAPQGPNPLGYEPQDTKKYLRDLELYGGKVNVLATEFMRWWEGLWHGRNLAGTVAVLTLLLASGFWFLATRMARIPESTANILENPPQP